MKINSNIFKPILLILMLIGMGAGYKYFINHIPWWQIITIAVTTTVLMILGNILLSWLFNDWD